MTDSTACGIFCQDDDNKPTYASSIWSSRTGYILNYHSTNSSTSGVGTLNFYTGGDWGNDGNQDDGVRRGCFTFWYSYNPYTGLDVGSRI